MKAAKYEIGDAIFRHGDVLLRKTDKPIPTDRPVVAHMILHAGNNHNHELTGKFVCIEDGSKKYVGILGPSKLDHAEHGPIEIKKRKTLLEVGVQVEYDPFLEESRAVID